jgi:hypothetical protein
MSDWDEQLNNQEWNHDDWKNNVPQSPEREGAPVESVTIFGVAVRPGDRVRLWPRKNADIMDLALKSKVAIVEAIERDFEDRLHLAVVLEDDPGRDLGMLRQPGHRFFFSPEEVEPLALNGEATHERK